MGESSTYEYLNVILKLFPNSRDNLAEIGLNLCASWFLPPISKHASSTLLKFFVLGSSIINEFQKQLLRF